MTFKRIFALAFALLFIVGSAFCVSAETPPYSEGFESESEMLTALKEYAEEYPDNIGVNLDRDIPKGYHLEYRQVLSIDIDITALVPMYFSFAESQYGQGVDYTFTSFDYENGYPGVLRAFVYYGYNTDEVLAQLETYKVKEGVSTFDKGTIDETPYVICKSDEDCDPPRIDYYLAINEYLVHIISLDPNIEDLLSKVKTQYTDVYIPVKIKDNADWFDNTIENGYVIGDVNSDNKLNIKDATALQKYCANLGSVDKFAADFNGDFKINVRDATDIQKKLAGLKYTCRRGAYPVTDNYISFGEGKLIEATTDYAGPFSNSELALIMNNDSGVRKYNTVFNSTEEFEAFFGKTLDRYDEEFFEENALVYLYRWYNSSLFMWTPDSLEFSDGILHVLCNYNVPDNNSELQMAFSNNNLFYEVSKADIEGLKGIWVTENTVVYD